MVEMGDIDGSRVTAIGAPSATMTAFATSFAVLAPVVLGSAGVAEAAARWPRTPPAPCGPFSEAQASAYLAAPDGVFCGSCELHGAGDSNPETFGTMLDRESCDGRRIRAGTSIAGH
jgi:hypothetical protein